MAGKLEPDSGTGNERTTTVSLYPLRITNAEFPSIDSLTIIFFILAEIPSLNISYKPQKISPKSQGTVHNLLHERIRDAYVLPQVIDNLNAEMCNSICIMFRLCLSLMSHKYMQYFTF